MIKYLITFSIIIISTSTFAAHPPTFELPHNKWRIISLPATPPDSANTLEKILGDDIGAGATYGQDWVVYAYNAPSNNYGAPVSLTDKLQKGRGYWIIQVFNQENVTLKMPLGSIETPNTETIPLASANSGSIQWNLAGNPFSFPLDLGQLRLTTDAPSCIDGNCYLDQAKEHTLVHNKVWTYDGNQYTEQGTNSQLNAWDGFWVATLENSKNHSVALTADVNSNKWDLEISSDGHMLQHKNNSGFFWMGDTAWEIFARLSRDEIDRYFADRSEKKFTVIQAIIMANQGGGISTPNPHGDIPFIDKDPTKPAVTNGSNPQNSNEYDFWDHVDYVIEKAAEKGMYIALLPANTTYVVGNGDILNPINARQYGQWIGNRYKDKPNLIWVLGGDINGNEGNDGVAVWDALAEGIKSVDSNHLMTYHPKGGYSSSEWFHNRTWLDFNMIQTGHCGKDRSIYNHVISDYYKTPVKPTLDGEPRYEDIPRCFGSPSDRVDAFETREAAYWQLFAGAFGHTYGHNSVWQMYKAEYSPVINPSKTWEAALNDPGAMQMKYVSELMQSRPILGRVPDQSLIVNGSGNGADHIQATRGNGYAFLYMPSGNTVTVAMGKISGSNVKAWWYNPRSGAATEIGTVENSGSKAFNPPGNHSRGNDWVLVLDDTSKNYGKPGQ